MLCLSSHENDLEMRPGRYELRPDKVWAEQSLCEKPVMELKFDIMLVLVLLEPLIDTGATS